MADEDIKFTLKDNQAPGLNYGANVDLQVTYDPTVTNADGSYTVTAATGTYQTLDKNGNVVGNDTITQLAPKGQFGHTHDNELFINGNPSASPIVTFNGIGFDISNKADTEDKSGYVDFYDQAGDGAGTVPKDRPEYQLDGTNNGNSVKVISEAPVCFTTGTRFRTARGEVAVEELRLGDLAVTASGTLRSIVWIGHRDLDGHDRTLPHDQQPIRVRAGAFGRDAAGRPAPVRDLRLSPGHPVLVGADADREGGYLVPIMCLINGTSVVREPATRVTYWHVELDRHDVLLAEGLPAESYLDWGDRPFFDEASDHVLHNPDYVVPGLSARCRPVAVDGPVVEAERARLDALFAAELDGHGAWDEADTFAWAVA